MNYLKPDFNLHAALSVELCGKKVEHNISRINFYNNLGIIQKFGDLQLSSPLLLIQCWQVLSSWIRDGPD